jgi:hypothetical protein
MDINYFTVKITKLKAIDSKKYSEVALNKVYEGVMSSLPKNGDFIYLYEDKGYSLRTILRTTKVVEINGNLYKTKNSIYKIITKEDERNEKINNIINSHLY